MKLGRPRGKKTLEGLRLVAQGLTVYAAAKRLKMPSQQLYKVVNFDKRKNQPDA